MVANSDFSKEHLDEIDDLCSTTNAANYCKLKSTISRWYSQILVEMTPAGKCLYVESLNCKSFH